jgi:excisionase family DNA binding protein
MKNGRPMKRQRGSSAIPNPKENFPASPKYDHEYMNIEELSDYLHIPRNTLYAYTCRKRIPHYKIRGSVRFEKKDIDEWMATWRVAPVSDPQN